MVEVKKIRTLCVRPVNAPEKALDAFAKIVLASGEVPLANLKRGLPMSEMLFLTIDETSHILGVGAVRFAQEAYHRHLFERAGAIEMYNPYSVESCWVAVRPEFRGMGVWGNNRKARLAFLGNRPCHSIRRADNKLTGGNREWDQAGDDFYATTSKDKLRLLVYNHEPVFDPKKRLQYV
ncbi:hypothetical protein [Sneathiella aquimaris]|uniref:hypothetical protein n=1 Tax=Sneathiella aquimaris TaxID=2599305 RepID=UPI00146E2A2C|nr:hypothetical protein [Sneathiella aquimaris]